MPSPHEHPYYEIGYLVGGTRRIFINHTSYTAGEGDLFVIKKNEIHRAMQIGEEGTNTIVLSFSEKYLTRLIERYSRARIDQILNKHLFHFEQKQKRVIEKLLHRMIFEYTHEDEFMNHLQENFIEELFIYLLRVVEQTESECVYYKDEENKRMEEAARFISTHFHKEITLSQIALRYGVSTSYFTKKFKVVTGFSFKEYLTAIRIREACNLLVESDLSITEIALKCGFSDSNYFGDAFKKVKGVSPKVYRKVGGFI